MDKILLLPHVGKPQAIQLAKDASDELKKLGIDTVIYTETKLFIDDYECNDRRVEDIRLAIVFGGDGAMLTAARELSPYRIPLLGINLGHLGFLTQVESGEIITAMERLAEGSYEIIERKMLDSTVIRNNAVINTDLAMNDIVISKGALTRIISLTTFVSGQHLATYRADGLIISSPTGSTAYSLSAGGPLVDPSINALIINPICAHTLNARPVIASGLDIIRVELNANHNEMVLMCDGKFSVPLLPGDIIEVRIADHSVRLIDVMGRNFYKILHKRVCEGRL